MDITITLTPDEELYLPRSLSPGQRLEELIDGACHQKLREHVTVWIARDQQALREKLVSVTAKLDAGDLAAIDAIVVKHTPVVVVDPPVEEVIP